MGATVPEITTVNITVEGEDYVLDCTEFTAREVGVIKRIGNVKGLLDVGPALESGDLELIVALAIIAAKRAGVTLDPEALLDGKAGVVKLSIPTPEGGDPPACMPEALTN